MLKKIALFVALLALGGCDKTEVATDLKTLHMAGQNATQTMGLEKMMGQTQQASTPADKAALMKETAAGLFKIQNEIEKADVKSDEVKALQKRMALAFGKTATAAEDAGTAIDNADSNTLMQAGKTMMQGQQEIISSGQDLSKMAKQNGVELRK